MKKNRKKSPFPDFFDVDDYMDIASAREFTGLMYLPPETIAERIAYKELMEYSPDQFVDEEKK